MTNNPRCISPQDCPAPASGSERRTYQTCNKHFSCPDGEECWYWSEDYYWDCGRGAQILMEAEKKAAAHAREKVLDEMRDLIRNAKKYGSIEPEELFHYTGLLTMIESLREMT